MRFLCVVSLVAACSRPNPDACCSTADQCLKFGFSDITPCSDGRVCSMEGNCVVPQCRTSSDCSDPNLVCDMYGQCVMPNQGSQFTLTVQIAGSGAGTVTSIPPGISCSAGTCSGQFDAGTQVQLSQVAAGGTFVGWTSACKGTDSCSVKMSGDLKVGAIFGNKHEVLWSKQISGTGFDWGRSVVPVDSGDVVAAGQFEGTLVLDTTTLQTGSDTVFGGYVARLDGLTGKTVWAKSFPVDNLTGVTADGGALYVTGQFSGTVQIANTTLVAKGSDDVFVMKLSADGEPVWATAIGGSGIDYPNGIAAGNGKVAVVGNDNGGITIGSVTYPPNGDIAGFVATFDAATGAPSWSRSFSAIGSTATALSMGQDLLVSGSYGGATDFGGGTVTPLGADGFVARYSADMGTLLDFNHIGGAGASVTIQAVSRDVAGNVIAAGSFAGSITVKGATYTTTAGVVAQAFVGSFSGTTPVWFENWATSGSQAISAPASISVGPSDIAIAGVYCGGSGSYVYINATTYNGVGCSAQNPVRSTFLVRMKDDGATYLTIDTLNANVWSASVTRADDERLFLTGKLRNGALLDMTKPLFTSTKNDDGYVLGFAP